MMSAKLKIVMLRKPIAFWKILRDGQKAWKWNVKEWGRDPPSFTNYTAY